jgi:hypothetical protein
MIDYGKGAQFEALALATRKLAQKRERRCLHCGRGFTSTGPGNRLCDPCRGRSNDVNTFDDPRAGSSRRPHSV